MKPYTRAATAESAYASGARSKPLTISTIVREAAATVNTP